LTGFLSYLLFFATIASIFAIATLGLNLQWGFSGQFNAGVAGFIAVGAYTQAILTASASHEYVSGFALPFPIALAASIAATAAVAIAVGLITIRLRTDYLALATYGIAASIQLLLLNLDSITGGGKGIISIPRPFGSLPPLGFTAAFLGLAGCLLVASYVALERLVRSPWGRVLRAIREDEAAAETAGVPTARYKLVAFTLSGLVPGMVGGLAALRSGYFEPQQIFSPTISFTVVAMAMIGGSDTVRGATMGAAFLVLLSELLWANLPELYMILLGLLLIGFVLFAPGGLDELLRRSATR